ncbi:MAG: cysteine desulfurase family protein [Patescibacteria group bacterium]|nr:cysteine desulfurase family protein [Patescibacteria group bacterium]
MKNNNKKVYLDYGATTPIDKDVVEKMIPFLGENFGNPSSLHSFGQDAVVAVDEARKKVADFLGSMESEVFFTGSATEANNIAILGSIKQKEGHIITTAIEHKAVLETVKQSGMENSIIYPDKNGIVSVDNIMKEVREDTVLISVMYANNEVGTVQPIKEISEAVKEVNKNRKNKIVFHTDAVQAVNYLPCGVNELNVDFLTFSGHKICGPKGVGVLYAKEGVNLSPLIFGGDQEKGVRPGTENVFAIVGIGEAVELISKNNPEKTRKLRDKIINFALENIPKSIINGDLEKRLPNNVNISFKGTEGESLMIALDREGIAVSTGSACASKSLQPSHVLLAMGLSHEQAHGSLRMTLGRFTTEEDVDYLLEKLPTVVEKIRKISPVR